MADSSLAIKDSLASFGFDSTPHYVRSVKNHQTGQTYEPPFPLCSTVEAGNPFIYLSRPTNPNINNFDNEIQIKFVLNDFLFLVSQSSKRFLFSLLQSYNGLTGKIKIDIEYSESPGYIGKSLVGLVEPNFQAFYSQTSTNIAALQTVGCIPIYPSKAQSVSFIIPVSIPGGLIPTRYNNGFGIDANSADFMLEWVLMDFIYSPINKIKTNSVTKPFEWLYRTSLIDLQPIIPNAVTSVP